MLEIMGTMHCTIRIYIIIHEPGTPSNQLKCVVWNDRLGQFQHRLADLQLRQVLRKSIPKLYQQCSSMTRREAASA